MSICPELRIIPPLINWSFKLLLYLAHKTRGLYYKLSGNKMEISSRQKLSFGYDEQGLFLWKRLWLPRKHDIVSQRAKNSHIELPGCGPVLLAAL